MADPFLIVRKFCWLQVDRHLWFPLIHDQKILAPMASAIVAFPLVSARQTTESCPSDAESA
jgi:hypothetical protein